MTQQGWKKWNFSTHSSMICAIFRTGLRGNLSGPLGRPGASGHRAGHPRFRAKVMLRSYLILKFTISGDDVNESVF